MCGVWVVCVWVVVRVVCVRVGVGGVCGVCLGGDGVVCERE